VEVKARAGIDSYLAVLGADLLTQRIRVDQQFLVHDSPGPPATNLDRNCGWSCRTGLASP
jgi:hypothetical protein